MRAEDAGEGLGIWRWMGPDRLLFGEKCCE